MFPDSAVIVGIAATLIGSILAVVLPRALDNRRRHRRQLDLMTAIHAEIMSGTAATAAQIASEERAYALSLSMPFASVDEADFVFQSIKADISILPTDIMQEVVLYYRLLSQAKAMATDMRNPIFRNLDAERQRKYLAEYLGIVRGQHIAGRIAIEAIEKYSRRSRLGLAGQRLELERRLMAERANLAMPTAR
jgi:hypothetical protein